MELEVERALRAAPKTWVVTGCAGFIGSHIAETLLNLGQRVIGADNFSTGSRENLEAIRSGLDRDSAARFVFHEGDIRDPRFCATLCAGADIVSHQAALGSVPRSIADPATSHLVNVDGSLYMLIAARDAGVERFVYASSSSVYGDSPVLPKVEGDEGRLLSPYAATKKINEVYAETFHAAYGVKCVGLRYFNVFGPRQSPEGEYAAVLPRWLDAMVAGRDCVIFGDGSNSRDFCYVRNAVLANLLAGTTASREALGTAFNIACGERTTLLELHTKLGTLVGARLGRPVPPPQFEPPRAGDIAHSHADISRAEKLLQYQPTVFIDEGLTRYVESAL